MYIWFQFLLVTIPALVVLFASYFIIKKMTSNTDNSSNNNYGNNNIHNTPTKPKKHINYQAYERLVLYLERINPSSLALRMNSAGINAKLLEANMVKTIRSEYEHNLSQQIYFSDEVWNLITKAKEETIQLINLGARNMNDDSSGFELSSLLIRTSSEVKELPHHIAIKYLKDELRAKENQ